VGPEWHNDGSFGRDVFGHVVYHIVKTPDTGRGNTALTHLGVAFDRLTSAVRRRMQQCVSVNSNGGAIHPLVFRHPVSDRLSLYLHLGMTGAVIEKLPTEDAAEEEGNGEGGETVGTPPAPAPVEDDRFGDGVAPPDLPPGRESKYAGFRAWRDSDMDTFFSAFSNLLDTPEVSYSHDWKGDDVIVVLDNLVVAHKASPGAHTVESGLRILHRTTVKSGAPLDAPEGFGLPETLDTAGLCPFEKGASWSEGYIGFRWGSWKERTAPGHSKFKDKALSTEVYRSTPKSLTEGSSGALFTH